MVAIFREQVEYRFRSGSVQDLIALADREYIENGTITCKHCGRGVHSSRQNVETFYTCSQDCYCRVSRSLVEDEAYVMWLNQVYG